MGWLFSPSWPNKETMRRHLTAENGIKTLKSCWKGNNLWAVQEYEYKEGPDAGKVVRFVALYMCRFGKGEGGYKDVDESMGPYQTNCPISYIEMVEAHEQEHGYGPRSYAAEWRESVRAAIAKANRKLQVGMKIKLYGHEYTIGKDLGSRGYLIQNSLYDYRMKKSQVKDVEVIE